MATEINLLRNRKDTSYEKKVLLGFRIAAVSSLVVVGFIALIVFFIQFRSPLVALQQEQQTLLTSMAQYKEKVTKYLLVSNRLTYIATILANRSTIDETLGQIKEATPTGVNVDTLSIDKKSVEFIAASDSLERIDEFVQNVVEIAEKNDDYMTLSLNSLSYNTVNGKYSISMRAQLL